MSSRITSSRSPTASAPISSISPPSIRCRSSWRRRPNSWRRSPTPRSPISRPGSTPRRISRTIRKKSPTSSTRSTPTRATPCRPTRLRKRCRASRSIPAFPATSSPTCRSRGRFCCRTGRSTPSRIGTRPCVRILWNAPARRRNVVRICARISFSRRKPSMAATDKSPLTKGYQPVTWNFKLLANDMLGGFGGMGEGMSVQIAPDGRRIIWLAHESAPKNFTAVDVSDPRKPKVVCQTDLPHANMRSNSLETCGNMMAVAYQTSKKDLQPAGFELFDISKPENPKSISFFDCSGPHSRGVHQLWFCDGEYVHCASGSRDFTPTHPQDDQFYRCVDVRNPSKPVEVGRWWMPGTRQGDNVRPPARHPIDKGFRAHNTNVYPQRPDRCYLAYIDGGMFVLDISDKANPKKVSQWTNSPPYTGFMHTIVPLFDRGLMLVTDESTENNAKDWPKLIWVLDAREETNLVPISTCPLPDHTIYAAAGRFGAHNIHENVPLPTAWQSDQIVLGTFFNGGLRAYDIANPYQPKEVGIFMPPAPPGAPTGTIQMNDVFVDERGIVYTVDRHIGGLYILEMDF